MRRIDLLILVMALSGSGGCASSRPVLPPGALPGTREQPADEVNVLTFAGDRLAVPSDWTFARGRPEKDRWGAFLPPFTFSPAKGEIVGRLMTVPIASEHLDEVKEKLLGRMENGRVDPERIGDTDWRIVTGTEVRNGTRLDLLAGLVSREVGVTIVLFMGPEGSFSRDSVVPHEILASYRSLPKERGERIRQGLGFRSSAGWQWVGDVTWAGGDGFGVVSTDDAPGGLFVVVTRTNKKSLADLLLDPKLPRDRVLEGGSYQLTGVAMGGRTFDGEGQNLRGKKGNGIAVYHLFGGGEDREVMVMYEPFQLPIPAQVLPIGFAPVKDFLAKAVVDVLPPGP
jgi:hypothetical protein